MPSTSIKSRVERLQHNRQPELLTTPLYDCIVDGKKMQLDPLDIAFYRAFNGCEVIQGPQSGVKYTRAATPSEVQENLREMDRIMDAVCEKYNSQTDEERRVEEEELRKIIDLRHQDWQAGRDPDKHHPLPPLY